MSSSGSTEQTPAGAPVGDELGEPEPSRLAPQHRPRPVFLLVGVVVAAILAAILFTTASSRGGSTRPTPGSAVPVFSLPRLGGTGHVGVPTDGGGNGRPAVVLFFASWCTPCQAEVPALAGTYRQQQAAHSRLAKVALIGVDGNDPTASALAFVHKDGVTFPVGVDRTYAVTSGLFAFTALPESVMVEGSGTIAAIHYGALSSADLVHWEQQLLADPR